MINSSQFFEWLVRHHTTVNLEKCLPYIEEGRIYQNGQPLEEGLRENKLYPGVIIIADGKNLIQRLKQDGVAWGVQEKEYTRISDEQSLSNYLSNLSNTDGAHIFDSVRGVATRARKIRDPLNLSYDFDPYDENMLSSMLPKDFVASDESVPLTEIGTRGVLALEIPQAYHQAHAFQIKQTAYGKLGMGKVAHFSEQGLVEEFFFRQSENHLQNTLNPKDSIQGVYRRYAKAGNELVKVAEEVRSLVYNPALASKQ